MFLKRAEHRNRTWIANDFLVHIYFKILLFFITNVKMFTLEKQTQKSMKKKNHNIPTPKENHFININIFYWPISYEYICPVM